MARAGALRGTQLAQVVALHDRDEHLPNQIERRPKRVLPVDYAAAADPHGGPGEPVVESVWIEPYPDELLGVEDELAGARGELRAARGRRARLRRGAPAPAGEPARGADPARGARVLGEGGRRRARDVGGLGQQRAPAGAQGGRGARSRAEPADDAARARRRRGSRRSSTATWRPGSRTTSRRSMEMLAEDASFAMPPLASGSAARSRSRIFLAGWPLSGAWRWRPIPTRANGQPALAFYAWDEDEEAYLPFALNVLTFRGERDQRRRRVRRAHDRPARGPLVRSLGRRGDRPGAPLRDLRELRPSRPPDR